MPEGYGRPANKDKREIMKAIGRIEGVTGKSAETRQMRVTQGRYTDEDFQRRLTGQNTALGKDIGEVGRQMGIRHREAKEREQAAAAKQAKSDAFRKESDRKSRNRDLTYDAQDRGQIPMFKENKASKAAGYSKGGMVKSHVNWSK